MRGAGCGLGLGLCLQPEPARGHCGVQVRVRVRLGLPTVGPPSASPLTEAHWADVQWGGVVGLADDTRHPPALLVTIGQGWFASPANRLLPGVLCPTLHRVAVRPEAMQRDRHSIPFLARIVPLEEPRSKPAR